MSTDIPDDFSEAFAANVSNVTSTWETEMSEIMFTLRPLSGHLYPDDPISSAVVLVVERTVLVGLLPALIICGVTMNVINMAVFFRQGLSDRINLCLFR